MYCILRLHIPTLFEKKFKKHHAIGCRIRKNVRVCMHIYAKTLLSFFDLCFSVFALVTFLFKIMLPQQHTAPSEQRSVGGYDHYQAQIPPSSNAAVSFAYLFATLNIKANFVI